MTDPLRGGTLVSASTRRFAVAWRNPSRPRSSAIGLLTFDRGDYCFSYAPEVRAVTGFRPLLGFPDFDGVYLSRTLFPFFAQRVMDRRRPDYARYLEALALPSDADALDVLGRSGGRRKADDVQVMEEPVVEVDGRTTCTFLAHGVRYAQEQWGAAPLTGDERLFVEAEADNPVNSRALLLVTTSARRVGWVPDLLLDFVHAVLATGEPDVQVVRVNGREQPDHLRLLVRLTGTAPASLRAFGALQPEQTVG